MSYTDGYQLNQWRMEDRIQMQDFNADNAKIDAALSRHSALLTDLSVHKGNCRIEYRAYTGTGCCGPDKALAQMNQANCTYVAVLFFAEDE